MVLSEWFLIVNIVHGVSYNILKGIFIFPAYVYTVLD